MKLSNLLKEARVSFNYTLKELSRISGIDMALLNKYEKGDRQPSEKHLGLLIEYLELNEDTALSLWLGERIYNLFEGNDHLFTQAMNFAEDRIKYTKLNRKQEESSISSDLTNLLNECSRLHEIWSSNKPLNELQLRNMNDYFNLNYTYESNRKLVKSYEYYATYSRRKYIDASGNSFSS